MSDSDTSGKILIVGGGLGGLALAQILYAHGVPFELFERDTTAESRKQGWAIALVEALPALKELLPAEMSTALPSVIVNHNTGDNDEIAFVDAVTGERVALIGGVPYDQPGGFIRASRDIFRSFLWKSNDLPVSSNKEFTHYCTTDDGVTAFFKDGSRSHGKLLVGADGLHSRVLDQLVGASEHKPVLSQYIPIFGELDLRREQYEPLRELASSAVLTASPGLRIQIGMLSMDPDGSKARYFWALMPRRENDPEILSDWVQTATAQELYDFCVQTIADLHPTAPELIRYGGPEALVQSQPKFLEFVPPPELPSGRVVVLGDAAHAMIPFRGAGANTAILDACDLAKLLIRAREERQDPAKVAEAYNVKMVPRGREAVLSSRAAGGADGDDPAVHFEKFQREKQ